MQQIHFCTFASSPNFTNTAKVLVNEAEKSGYFNSIICYDQYFVAKTYPEHLSFFTEKFYKWQLRGFGYWLWKPLVILSRLSELPLGDILFYADGGCAINTNENAQKNFQMWVRDIESHSTHRISFQMAHPEEKFTKGSLLAYMNRTGDQTGQYSATIQGYKHTPENIAFVKRWIEIATMDNYHFITDEPSTILNADSFVDHRHDQSIYSLLIKELGTATHPDYYPNTIDYPIVAARRCIQMQHMDVTSIRRSWEVIKEKIVYKEINRKTRKEKMEVIKGIILCFSEQTEVPYIPSWKKIIVSYGSNQCSGHVNIKCETGVIYGIKRLALVLNSLFSTYIIAEGVLVVYDGTTFNPRNFTSFIQSEKNDFMGYGPGISSVYKPSQEDLKQTVDDPYILGAYQDCSFPLYPFTRRPKISGVSGMFYLSNKACRVLYEHMEDIQFDVFSYDTESSSYPYTIENCAVSFIMYKHDISLHYNPLFNLSNSDGIAKWLPSKDLSIAEYGVGFFSCCNTRLVKIIEFFNEHHTLPEKVNSTDQFKWYKPEKYYRDITPLYFQTKIPPPTFCYTNPIRIVSENCSYEDQFCDYQKHIQYDSLRPFLEAYFQLTPLIERIARDIVKKYSIDFVNTCVLFYRGNDKINETKLCPYEEVIEKAKKVNEKYPDIKFMIQSDETAFITTMMETFPNAFYCSDEIRHINKRNDTTVDYEFKSTTHEFSKKFLAITWIMSQCKYVVSGSSGNCLLWMTYYRGHSNNIFQYLNGEWIDNIL